MAYVAVGDFVWTCADGKPSQGTLRKCAVVRADGLVSTDITNINAEAGCNVGKIALPDAFRFEAEFSPALDYGDVAVNEATRIRQGVLFDSLYVTEFRKGFNRGLQVAVDARGGYWHPIAYFGFGDTVCRADGPRVRIAEGKPLTLSFTYDANRRVQWRFGDVEKSCTIARFGAVAPSARNAIIGDRIGSYYHAFDGAIRRVAITAIERRLLDAALDGRTAFVRGEEGATLHLHVENFSTNAVKDVQVRVQQLDADGKAVGAIKSFAPATLPADIPIPVETRVAPGHQSVRVCLAARDKDGKSLCTDVSLMFGVGPRFAERMPVLAWGGGPQAHMKEVGFTHELSYGLGRKMPREDTNRLESAHAYLDEALVNGLRIMNAAGIRFPGKIPLEYQRLTRAWKASGNGVPNDQKPAVEASNPAFIELSRRVAAENAAEFGTHPAYAGSLPNSEVVDHAFPSFNAESDLYKKETGREVPPEVTGKTLSRAVGERLHPDGIVPDDDPVLAFYRWWWRDGNGWPRVQGAIAREYRKVSRNVFSFFDPAVRCPPIWGSGGDVEVLNQWVYAVPEPLAVAGTLEEMFAMAKGRPGQDVMIMTQLICYRSTVAPMGEPVRPLPEWVVRRPQAKFVTIPPDSFQEATWSMLAKPVKGIMYHGYGTIYETREATGYVFTNGETTERAKRMFADVVAPLGPTLLKVGRAPQPVAVLESFTSVAMGGPHSWGWRVPAVTFLQRARLDPRVVYEEEILRDGLDGVKVLYLPQCRFLTPSVLAKIQAFQKAGGTLVADAECVKALKPDILVPVEEFPKPPKSDHTEDMDALQAETRVNVKARAATEQAKRTMFADAEKVRKDLASVHRPAADSSSPELITYARRWKDTDYLFVVNDHRTFGDYVGQWGLTMEKGLPFEGWASLADPQQRVKAVYELSRGGKVRFERDASGAVRIPLKYETNDGRLLLFLDREIASVKVEAPSSVRPGDMVKVTFRVLDAEGRPVSAALPVEIRLFDAKGRELDGAGYVCAEGGGVTASILTNVNDARGDYRLVCRDRASGLSTISTIRGNP